MRLVSVLAVALAWGCSAAPADAPVSSASQTSSGSASCLAAPAAFTMPALAARGDSLDEALADVGLDRASFAISPVAVANNGLMPPRDPRRLADIDTFGRSPLAMTAYAHQLGDALDRAAQGEHPVSSAIAVADARRATGTSQAWPSTCLEAQMLAVSPTDPAPLATALVAVGAGAPDLSGVPIELELPT